MAHLSHAINSMLQTATMYKENEAIMSKEYYFKVQSISGGSNKKRSTFAKTKIDLAKYCNCDSNEAREVYIPLRYPPPFRYCYSIEISRFIQPVHCTPSARTNL
jgi:hypothetical protein